MFAIRFRNSSNVDVSRGASSPQALWSESTNSASLGFIYFWLSFLFSFLVRLHALKKCLPFHFSWHHIERQKLARKNGGKKRQSHFWHPIYISKSCWKDEENRWSTANPVQFEWEWTGLAVLFSRQILNDSHIFFHPFIMSLDYKWGVKNGFTFALQFLSSPSLPGYTGTSGASKNRDYRAFFFLFFSCASKLKNC